MKPFLLRHLLPYLYIQNMNLNHLNNSFYLSLLDAYISFEEKNLTNAGVEMRMIAWMTFLLLVQVSFAKHHQI